MGISCVCKHDIYTFYIIMSCSTHGILFMGLRVIFFVLYFRIVTAFTFRVCGPFKMKAKRKRN